MITIIIISNTTDKESFNLSINDKIIKKDFSEIKNLEEKTNLANLISLVKNSNANMFSLQNFNSMNNIELFLCLKDYNLNEFKEFNFNNLNDSAKKICLDFFSYYFNEE